jgi:tetratricopeptide (TPR) repeat protein
LKAFFYTLILTAVLIAAIIFLQSLPQPAKTRRAGPHAPMTVKSEPARLATVERNAETMNRDALFDTGVELLDLWHLPEAVGIFETVVDIDSTHVGAYLKLIECYSDPMVALENEARRCFDKALQLCRRTGADTLWVFALGSYYVARDPDPALAALKGLDRKAAKNDEVVFLFGAAYLEKGELGQVERLVGNLLDKDPSLGRAKELFIRAKTARGDYGEAERLAKDLAAIYPEEPYPYILLSQVLLLRGEIDEALEFANNALRLDPRYIPAIVSRAHIHVAQGELEAARVNFEKLLLFDRPMLSAIAMDGIAYVEFLSGSFEQAARDMDEAIRLAMSAGSTRQGLVYASRLIDYLCQLGRPDVAETVLDRWVARSGDIPSRLGQLRILIVKGDVPNVRHGLERIKDAPEWRRWMRWLEIDYTDMYALSLMQDADFAGALALMDAAGPTDGPGGRRAYLKGYAHFENGAAERAADFLAKARTQMHSLEFPYHSDPVLYVQSIFFSAEAALARGESEEAKRYYADFLDLWGDADWELQAVTRARSKLETLSSIPPSG